MSGPPGLGRHYICSYFFFFSRRRRHTRLQGDRSSDVCSSDLDAPPVRHPQEVRGIEPALGGPRVPDELDTLSRIDEYAIQIEQDSATLLHTGLYSPQTRSEERRVGKECRARWSSYH